MALGTILPNEESFRRSEKYARASLASKAKIANGSAELAGAVIKKIGGEIRYYLGGNVYAIVGRGGKILKFTETPDGDFPIR